MAPLIKFARLGLEYVERFTDAHRAGRTMFERESLCERVQFPSALVPARSSDWLAGKRTYPEVGYSVQYGGVGFYADFTRWPSPADPLGYCAEELEQWEALRTYWKLHDATHQSIAAFDPAYTELLSGSFCGFGEHDHALYPLFRMAGLQLDLRKLVTLGLPGLEAQIDEKLARSHDPDVAMFRDACHAAIETFRRSIDFYVAEAGMLPDAPRRTAMTEALLVIRDAPPTSFHEALQLVFLSSTLTGTINFGRLDVVLGDFLCADLDAGRISWAHAMDLLANFYVLIEEEIMQWDGRVIIGGRGRPDEATADRFAMLAMDVTDALNLPMPQLSLRFYDGQDPALMDRAFDVIAHGKTYPMLYNDDINIPAVEKAFKVDRPTAEQYLPYGCGEYIIYHQSCGTPNAIINLVKALEATVNHGKSLSTGLPMAPDVGGLADYASFEALWEAYDQTVTHLCNALGHAQAKVYEIMSRTAPFSMVSVLYDDCLDRGLPIFSGGIRYLGGTNETYGNANCADCLTAIRQLVYDRKQWSAAQLMEALRNNWEGAARMRRDFRHAPKYGNDDDVADGMLLRVHNHICQRTSQAGANTPLHHFLAVVINNKFNSIWGASTSASADGRTRGEALAPGNAPGGGRDVSGLTAVLNSQAKPDPSIHAGAVQNVKLTSSFPAGHPDLYRTIINSYFKQGGAQLMVTVTNRHDLEAALKEPEKYANLIVRVGGFSARFIDLDTFTQAEILSRTEHGI